MTSPAAGRARPSGRGGVGLGFGRGVLDRPGEGPYTGHVASTPRPSTAIARLALVLAILGSACAVAEGEDERDGPVDSPDDARDAPLESVGDGGDADGTPDAPADDGGEPDAGADADVDADVDAAVDVRDDAADDAGDDRADDAGDDAADDAVDSADDAPADADDGGWVRARHVDIYIDNFCNTSVDPTEITVPPGETLQIAWHNNSVDYDADVWLSYGGGYLELATGGIWDDSFEFCSMASVYDAYGDVSIAGGPIGACPGARLLIHCL